eukprot:6619965-Karenia_brevis.AAC.1
MQFVEKTRFLASVQLFDAIWRVLFHCMRNLWHEPEAAAYMFDTYFLDIPADMIKKIYKCVTTACWGETSFLVAGHWYGILGTAAGERHCHGSQTPPPPSTANVRGGRLAAVSCN